MNDPILKFHVFRRFSRAVIREQILTGFIGNLRSVAHAGRSAVKFVLLLRSPSLTPLVVIPFPRNANGEVGSVAFLKLDLRGIDTVPVRVAHNDRRLAVDRPAVKLPVKAGINFLYNILFHDELVGNKQLFRVKPHGKGAVRPMPDRTQSAAGRGRGSRIDIIVVDAVADFPCAIGNLVVMAVVSLIAIIIGQFHGKGIDPVLSLFHNVVGVIGRVVIETPAEIPHDVRFDFPPFGVKNKTSFDFETEIIWLLVVFVLEPSQELIPGAGRRQRLGRLVSLREFLRGGAGRSSLVI